MWFNTTFGLDFYAILIPTAVLSGLLSVATYLVIFRPARRRNVGGLEMIIISFGLSILLRATACSSCSGTRSASSMCRPPRRS